ncbi:13350_t:CDS:1 [Cetraspora pellucida]|uniref:13350_t:CDS:1 n=1 Tax=Cetraspora pellucida TaxID=1433469 RepID=A0ACA9P815_9GLOM|nr:13350_t:CDS:1 [Cetraspora pellucida]
MNKNGSKKERQKGSKIRKIKKGKSKSVSNLLGDKKIKQDRTYPDDAKDFELNIVDLSLRNRVEKEKDRKKALK